MTFTKPVIANKTVKKYDPDAPFINTPKFPDKNAEIAYKDGYSIGFTNGVMDE